MRLIWLLPLAYLAGEYGFAIFAPYLALFLPVALLLRRRRALAPVRSTHATTIPTFQK
jgi:hypothetical protein